MDGLNAGTLKLVEYSGTVIDEQVRCVHARRALFKDASYGISLHISSRKQNMVFWKQTRVAAPDKSDFLPILIFIARLAHDIILRGIGIGLNVVPDKGGRHGILVEIMAFYKTVKFLIRYRIDSIRAIGIDRQNSIDIEKADQIPSL